MQGSPLSKTFLILIRFFLILGMSKVIEPSRRSTMSTGVLSGGFKRAKSRRFFTTPTHRAVSCSIILIDSNRGLSEEISSRMSWTNPRMIPRGLLISCAIPAASSPINATLLDRLSWSWSIFRSARSLRYRSSSFRVFPSSIRLLVTSLRITRRYAVSWWQKGVNITFAVQNPMFFRLISISTSVVLLISDRHENM